MEFNIRKAVSTWKEFGRNFGLVVTVEDEEGVLLPADKFIHTMKCSDQTGENNNHNYSNNGDLFDVFPAHGGPKSIFFCY